MAERGRAMFFKNPKKEQEKEARKAAEKSAALREEAMKNVKDARERLGDETIQKIAEALKAQSAGKIARDKIREMDKERIAEHLRSLLEEDR